MGTGSTLTLQDMVTSGNFTHVTRLAPLSTHFKDLYLCVLKDVYLVSNNTNGIVS